jgi:putative transposase
MAKSVLNAGWGTFRAMLQYKCDDAGVWFGEVDERYSTQDCSTCGTRAGPAGRQGLAVRSWQCPCCGTQHDRDVNAAINIRNRGLVWLEQQFSDPGEPEGNEAGSNEAASAAGAGYGPPSVGIPVL